MDDVRGWHHARRGGLASATSPARSGSAFTRARLILAGENRIAIAVSAKCLVVIHHALTERLLGIHMVFSPTAQGEIEHWEEKHNIRWPASVREWFEKEDAITILHDCSNCDSPLPIAGMPVLSHDGRALVQFMNENQGCCRWAFRVDASDDPEALVQFQGREWQSCACTFSGFVEGQVFDWEGTWAEDGRTLRGDWPSATTLAWLRERFSTGPTSQPYAEEQPRFFDANTRLTIWRNWIWPSEKAEWRLSAKTFDSLDRMLDVLQPFYDEEL